MTDTIKISRELRQQGAQLLDNWDSGHPAYDLSKLGLEAVELVRALLAQPSEPHCKWVRDEDTGFYKTQCGQTWHLSDGGEPEEHGQYYCHHCGKPIDEEVQPDED
jgi:hypothetical protein